MTNSYTENSDGFTGNYNGEILKLRPVKIENARIVDGNQFPYGLEFESKPESIDTAIQFLKDLALDGYITKLLIKHGALLIRGTGDANPETFAKLVTTIETARGLKPFEQIGLAGKRNIVAENVFTANEGPKTTRFYQHNEYARYTNFPRCIHFFSSKAAPLGGGSPIASSIELFERLKKEIPEEIKKLSHRTIKSSQLYPSKTGKINFKGNEFHWEDYDSFGQLIDSNDLTELDKRKKAEISIQRLTNDFNWNDDNSVTIHQYVPPFRLHPEKRVPVSFNGLVGRHGTRRDAGATDYPFIGKDGGYYPPITFDNNDPVPNEILDKFLEISCDIEYNHKWQEGDLVLVDNYQVSHGREPWDGGDRVVLVSMWDDDSQLHPYKED